MPNGIPENARWEGPPDAARRRHLLRAFFYDSDGDLGPRGALYSREHSNAWIRVYPPMHPRSKAAPSASSFAWRLGR
jgi:hypothetical protein